MFGKVLGGQRRIGLNGSGALSHVYIQHPPLRCGVPGGRGLYYDDGNKLLLSPASSEVFSWRTAQSASSDIAPTCDQITEGPVLSIRYSLDGKVIGIQRSSHEIEFRNRETGEIFSQKCKSESESILGFFWSDCPTCNVVFVKTSGLDLFSYQPELKVLRLVETKRVNVSWYVYTHESRMVLLASGMQCKIFSGFQFSSGGIIRLPRFEMDMTKAEANNKPVLAAEDVHIVTTYGRIYCLQLDRVGMMANLYRFYRDAVVLQGSLPVYSLKIAVSVVDNVLLVHQVDAKVVILYDLFTNSLAPISAPLPLLLRGFSRPNSNVQSMNVEVDGANASELIIYDDGWTFLVPDLICDTAHGMLWRIHLDLEDEPNKALNTILRPTLSLLLFCLLTSQKTQVLSPFQLVTGLAAQAVSLALLINNLHCSHAFRASENKVSKNVFCCQAIAASSSEVPSVLEFLQRRRLESHKAKQLCLVIMRTIILERRPVSMIALAIDVLVASYSHLMRTGTSIQGGTGRAGSGATHHVDVSQGTAEEANTKGDEHGKSVTQESTSGLHHNPLNLDSLSDSEENANVNSMGTHSGEHPEQSLLGDIDGLGNQQEKNDHAGTATSHMEIVRSPLQSEVCEASSNPSEPNASDQQGSQFNHVAISPDEMYSSVFALVEEEIAGDSAYLVAVIVEYIRSSALEKLKLNPSLYVMTIQLLARNERYDELGLFIINKILEPSKEVALQLLESGWQNLPTRKLGSDMLRQLSLHHDYVLQLVQDGYCLEALRYARKHKVNTIRPSLFLEAAFVANDPQRLAAVLRFFSDFIPGFRKTSDHKIYCGFLKQMS